jgi:lipoate-protein ligase A
VRFLGRAEYKVQGGKLIKVQLSIQANKISYIKITGDFFMHPEEVIEELEKALIGEEFDKQNLTRYIATFMEKNNVVLLGALPQDFAKCILLAGGKDG